MKKLLLTLWFFSVSTFAYDGLTVLDKPADAVTPQFMPVTPPQVSIPGVTHDLPEGVACLERIRQPERKCGPGSDGYWCKLCDPIPLRAVVERYNPAGVPGVLAWSNLKAGIIEIRYNLNPRTRECLVNHEKKHFEGFVHPIGAHFAIDCGDGTMIRNTSR